MPVDYLFGLFANLAVLFAYILVITMVGIALWGLVALLALVAADWSQRNTREQREYRETNAERATADVTMLATFICYLVAVEQARSEPPKPKYVIGRLLSFAEQYPSERQRFVREAIRVAKKAGLGAEVIIDQAEPLMLRSTVSTMRDELQDWGTDGKQLTEYVLHEQEVH